MTTKQKEKHLSEAPKCGEDARTLQRSIYHFRAMLRNKGYLLPAGLLKELDANLEEALKKFTQ